MGDDGQLSSILLESERISKHGGAEPPQHENNETGQPHHHNSKELTRPTASPR